MSRRIIDFDDPDGFAARAVGEPGERSFYLQATKGADSVSVSLEREQIEVLAERTLVVIDELERRGLAAIDAGVFAGGAPVAWPVQPTPEPREDFQASTLTIAWDEDVDRLIIEARSPVEDPGVGSQATSLADGIDDEDVPDDAPIGPDVLRVRLRLVMAQRFARQAEEVVSDGRPRCPFCGQPLDRTGHLCPRRDGPTEYLQ